MSSVKNISLKRGRCCVYDFVMKALQAIDSCQGSSANLQAVTKTDFVAGQGYTLALQQLLGRTYNALCTESATRY